ncbi:MAG: hypothetical protein EP330_08805 [Deltaproteobacteria bacterium]|nr:MAG: hypothetical protein EP330_08805 [Deltaproteobacteria bacterium]
MLDKLKPLTLGEAARQIGIDPFEVVRLLVQRGEAKHLRIPRSKISELREFAGVEVWWTPDVAVVEDDNHLRGRARTALGMLLDREHIGKDAVTRVDNLWRGLPLREQGVLDRVVEALAAEGMLYLTRTERGLQVAVKNKNTARSLRKAVKTGAFAASVAECWEQQA